MKSSNNKEIEAIVKLLTSTTKEKSKLDCCSRLIEIFESRIDVDFKFEIIIQSINEFSYSNNIVCKKIWLKVTIIEAAYQSNIKISSRI